ncbi:hypothetical protein [Acinetobacter sp. S54]
MEKCLLIVLIGIVIAFSITKPYAVLKVYSNKNSL